ncbi:Zinc finger CCHC domain-containing protein 12 [Holothuria leucospilota]|uniref:Zinc finger CCHC domain-containing protein 12 n=1 Tax=Holothuria leucospilota TaxID=206669 RepID=A0A9Q0YAD3_HOLLE|nr:Zinc finger CCHC domain-containing protein 12 [Holothuria leucospilota]
MLRSQGFIIQSPCKTGGINTVPPASHQPAPATYVPPPRISPFSGDKVTKVGEVAFESWVYEVKCLRRGGYSEATLAPIVRRSLRGEAAQLTMRLGLDASIEEILKKLEGRYGTVESGASLLQQFYNTKQLANETVAEFGNRLEVSIRKAQERGGILQAAVDEALRVVFWMGLQNDKVKVAIRHQKDSVPDFDALIRLARIAEQEDTEHAKQTPKEARVSQQAAVEVPSALDEVERLKAQVAELSRQLQHSRMPPVYSQPPPGNLLQARSDQRKCYRCLNYGHIARECKNEVTCLRCGKSGHIASRCNEPLNQNGPLPEGGR